MPALPTKARIKHTLIEETKKMLWLSLYLFAFLAALASYRAVLLGKDGAGTWPLFHCAVEALVLAKVMLIGNALRLGERFFQRRMFARTISRALAFAVFALVFSAAEELVTGWFRGKSFQEMWQVLVVTGPLLVLARGVMLFVFFVPLMALWEIARALGEGKLHAMFFELPQHANAPGGNG
jgi:hypothetical protein